MDPKIIAEIWQAMSLLSDAQEMLDREPETADVHINHAKRHLQLGMSQADRDVLLEVLRLTWQGCSLGEDSLDRYQEPMTGNPIEGSAPNPVIALEIITQDGANLRWEFEQPLPQAEWFFQMETLGAKFGLGINIALPEDTTSLLEEIGGYLPLHGDDCVSESGCPYPDDQCGGRAMFLVRQLGARPTGWEDST